MVDAFVGGAGIAVVAVGRLHAATVALIELAVAVVVFPVADLLDLFEVARRVLALPGPRDANLLESGGTDALGQTGGAVTGGLVHIAITIIVEAIANLEPLQVTHQAYPTLRSW